MDRRSDRNQNSINNYVPMSRSSMQRITPQRLVNSVPAQKPDLSRVMSRAPGAGRTLGSGASPVQLPNQSADPSKQASASRGCGCSRKKAT